MTLRVGLVSPATYNRTTRKPNQGEMRLLLPLTWSAVTGFLNGTPERDRYTYVHFDDTVHRDPERLADCDVVLFTALTGQIQRAIEIADQLRALAPKRQKFVLGGIHVTAIVKETLRAYLYRQLEQSASKSKRTLRVVHDESRITPLDTVISAAANVMPAEQIAALQLDPYRFLMSKVRETAQPEALFDRAHVPGPWYLREMLALHERFDLTVSGLIDGGSPVREPVRERLIAEIESDRSETRSILTTGFGDVSAPYVPNWRVYFQDGMPERLFPSPLSSEHNGKRTPVLTYETGRGCQHTCDFCSVVNFFGPLDYRDTDRVVSDLLYGIETFGAYEYFFVDDNINGSPKRFRALVDALQRVKDKHPKFGWAGQLTFEHVARYEGDIGAAKRSGMNSVYLGLETVDDETNADINKPHNRREEIVAGLQLFKHYGIVAYCNVILGLPTDGAEFPARMVQGLRELDVPAIVPFTCSYLPGTALFNRLYRDGDRELEQIVATNWKYNNSFDVVHSTMKLNVAEVDDVRREFVERYASHERMVTTAASYYKPMPWSIKPLDYIDEVGNLAQIIAFNLMTCDALEQHRHYMACGPYRIDLRRFLRVYRDAARRRESGVSGIARVGVLAVLTAAAPLLQLLFERHPIGSFLDWNDGRGGRVHTTAS
jgi:hypothetical protein